MTIDRSNSSSLISYLWRSLPSCRRRAPTYAPSMSGASACSSSYVRSGGLLYVSSFDRRIITSSDEATPLNVAAATFAQTGNILRECVENYRNSAPTQVPSCDGQQKRLPLAVGWYCSDLIYVFTACLHRGKVQHAWKIRASWPCCHSEKFFGSQPTTHQTHIHTKVFMI